MPTFKINAKNGDGEMAVLYLDTTNMRLLDENKERIDFQIEGNECLPNRRGSSDKPATVFSEKNPVGKRRNPWRIRLQLGLSCNYSCGYCNQRFVPHSDESAYREAQGFIDGMSKWYDGGSDGLGSECVLEFWGGEPLVYFKTIKKLAKAIREKYPKLHFSMITNGSLLTDEVADFLIHYGFSFAISHDAVGQHVRGADPLDNPKTHAVVTRLLEESRKENPRIEMSFNYVMNRHNYSRADVENFFREKVGSGWIHFGEAHMPTFHDYPALDTALSQDELFKYRTQAIHEIIHRELNTGAHTFLRNVDYLLGDLANGRQLNTYTSGCNMEDPGVIACNLSGDILTCQNVSTVTDSVLNGKSHKIGSVYDIENALLNTSTHWSLRAACANCPVAMLCRGVCLYMGNDDLFDISCRHSYSDYIVMMSVAVFMVTGYMPVWIEGVDAPIPYHMSDVFGDFPELDHDKPAKRVIPIASVA